MNENDFSDLRSILHGVPLTKEQRECHEEAGESFHIPIIVHRSGGVSAERLNICGICGAQIVPTGESNWISVSDETAEAIRKGR